MRTAKWAASPLWWGNILHSCLYWNSVKVSVYLWKKKKTLYVTFQFSISVTDKLNSVFLVDMPCGASALL